jgi:hypothetical protein
MQPQAELRDLARAGLLRGAPDAAARAADAIRARHRDAVVAVLFYGSCLRKASSEGVLDFYVLVDDYAGAHASRAAAWLNAIMPPSVYYLECADAKGRALRAKYALVSSRDFLRAAGPRSVRPASWARFCQPALAVWTRDAAALEVAVASVARSIETALERTLPRLPDRDGCQCFDSESFWQTLFRETYAAELRPESDAAIRSLYASDPQHFARALELALAVRAETGQIAVRREADQYVVLQRTRRLRRTRAAAALRRPAAKLLALVQLLKSAFTFGDWLPYALWKLERHTGTHLEPTPRQRRHPWLFGWPLILRVLRRGELR